MKLKKFVIILKTRGDTIIDQTNLFGEVDDWAKNFHESEAATDFKVYQRNGLGYECIIEENKRSIGF